MKKRTLRLWQLTLILTLAAGFSACTAHAKDTVKRDVMIPMRDGVKLATDIYIPDGDGPFPVIIERTPYGRGGEEGEGFIYTERGYACVIQSCRGRRNSEGEWEPFVNERDDGLDTHAWILKQPWCNGKIGTIGGSYSGLTAWSVAADTGPSHKAITTSNPLMNGYHDLANIGGAFGMGTLMTWGSMMARPTEGEIEDYDADEVDHWDWDKAFRRLPLSQWDKNLGFEVSYMRNWIKHETFDEYWEPSDISKRIKDIDVPGVITTGWYDLFNSMAFNNVSAMRKHARDPKGRMQYLVCGPWSHGGRHARDFGDDSDFAGDRDLMNNWMDYWLKDKKMDLESLPPYRLFVMGRNKWRTADQWPLKDTQFTPWYFHSDGSANTLNGDGKLSTEKPCEQPTDKFTYDPKDPVPTVGGSHLAELGASIGAHEQQKVERRKDVLVYTSEPVKEKMEVTGPVKVVLYAASSARCTDWTAKLVVVEQDGTAYNLCDGIQRARWREGGCEPKFIEPGKVYRYEIDLWMTSNEFLPGQRIRVDISSSNFPRFDRNPNTGNPFGQDAELKTAEQEVYHNKMYPSHIILPVVPPGK